MFALLEEPMQTNLRLQLSQWLPAYVLRTTGFLQVWLHRLLPRREAGRHKAGENNSRHVHSCGLTHSCSVPSALPVSLELHMSSESPPLPPRLFGMSKARGQHRVILSWWMHGDLLRQFLEIWRGKELHLQQHLRNSPGWVKQTAASQQMPLQGIKICCQNGLCGIFHPHGDTRSHLFVVPLEEELWIWLQMENMQGWLYGSEGHLSPFLSPTFTWKSHGNLPLRKRETEVLEATVIGCINLPNPANAWEALEHMDWQDERSRSYLMLYGLMQ